MCEHHLSYWSSFLFSWNLSENQSEERHAPGWWVWGGPTIFTYFSAGPFKLHGIQTNSQVLWSMYQLSSIFKPFIPWLNIKMWQHCIALHCTALNSSGQKCLIISAKLHPEATPNPSYDSQLHFPAKMKLHKKRNKPSHDGHLISYQSRGREIRQSSLSTHLHCPSVTRTLYCIIPNQDYPQCGKILVLNSDFI